MPTGPEAFLGMPDASGLRPCAQTHLKKGLVPYLPVWWDGQQIPLVRDFFLEPEGAVALFGGVRLISWRLRGMPTGPEVFGGMLGACGLRPYTRTYLKKKGFVPYSSGRWAGWQIPLPTNLSSATCPNNDKHRFILHWTFGSNEFMTSKVTWHTCRETYQRLA